MVVVWVAWTESSPLAFQSLASQFPSPRSHCFQVWLVQVLVSSIWRVCGVWKIDSVMN